MVTHYHTLGLEATASLDEIRQAYRRLAVKYHPDKNPDDKVAEERFKRVNEAYQVLSDPAKKASYDLKIQYQDAQQAYRTYQRYSPPPPNPSHGRWTPHGYRYKQRRGSVRTFTPQEERKSTYYAFGFVGVMAVIVVILVQINKAYMAKQMAEKEARRAELMLQMQDFCLSGEVDSAVWTVQQLQREGFIKGEEEDARARVMAQLYGLAEKSFYDQDYPATVYYGNLVNEGWPHEPVRDLNLWMAKSHVEMGEKDKALQRLDSLMAHYPHDVMPFMEAARLVVNDRPKDALRYYIDAISIITSQYKARYGEGYMLVMSPSEVPSYHFEIFLEVGKAYIEAEDYKMGENLLRWAVHINRKHEEGYRWLAECYTRKGEPSRGCQVIRRAISRGYLNRTTTLTGYCD
ncbi:MAG: DnaJ domain-containing protein [Bacteroidota bacterium]